jgi:hypothetical protein
MELSINTPALLFPAISLLLLAYTNRFLAIANLVRRLYEDYRKPGDRGSLARQLRSLRRRLHYIRQMQTFGAFSFLLCVACMYCIYNGWDRAANAIFASSLLSLLVSLFISLVEIWQSTRALDSLLSEAEELTDDGLIGRIFGFREGERESP